VTCIAGIVDKDGAITLGGDSAGVSGLDVTVRKDPKVFIKGSFIYGFTSSFRMGQVLQYRFDSPDHDPRWDIDTFLRTVWIDSLRKAMETGGYARKDSGQESAGCFMFGYKGRLFFVDSDYQIGEPSLNYYAVGCGADYAKGVLFSTADSKLTASQRVQRSLECAERFSGGVRSPFVIHTLSKDVSTK
jgi:ATP-dependent protease HslVU (ClpYQ) peptidase subunit